MTQFASLRGRTVLITGGTRGLGWEMAVDLLEAGCNVAVTGSGAANPHALPAEYKDRTLSLTADVADPEACDKAVDATRAKFGKCEVLINNAGRGMLLISQTFNVTPTKFWEADAKAVQSIMDTNVMGPFNMARAAVPHMVKEGFGKVINISTSDQTMVRAGYFPYGPSKAVLEASSRVWAQDLKGTGVDVNVYLPGGAADTDLLPQTANKKGADGNLLPSSIMRRGIRWLCADESNGVTGNRFIARLWDDKLPPNEAAKGAASPHIDKPQIM